MIAYKEISRVVVEIKMECEILLAKIAEIKMEIGSNKNNSLEARFYYEYEKLEKIPLTIYKLFSYASFIDKKVLNAINVLYHQTCMSLNPNIALS